LTNGLADSLVRPGLRVVESRWTFVVLQVLDILTTLAAFHVGAFEANPLVARLTREFGVTGGLIAGKLMALLIVMGVRRRVWIVNIFYGAVVVWNTYVVLALSARHPQ
jgi:hypothetical protein